MPTKPKPQQPDDDKAEAMQQQAGAVAVLDPPPEIDDAQTATVIQRDVASGRASAGEMVEYWVDPTTGRCTRAELVMWRGPTRYTARAQWDGTHYQWLERQGEEWVSVKRGQSTMTAPPIIEQAREYALNRVFGGWPG